MDLLRIYRDALMRIAGINPNISTHAAMAKNIAHGALAAEAMEVSEILPQPPEHTVSSGSNHCENCALPAKCPNGDKETCLVGNCVECKPCL